MAHVLRVGLGQGELGLHLEAGQRRAHLVRGVGDEALLRLQVLLQPRHHVVEGAMTRRTSSGTPRGDRRQVGGATAADGAAAAG
jgi:hypothetical protein